MSPRGVNRSTPDRLFGGETIGPWEAGRPRTDKGVMTGASGERRRPARARARPLGRRRERGGARRSRRGTGIHYARPRVPSGRDWLIEADGSSAVSNAGEPAGRLAALLRQLPRLAAARRLRRDRDAGPASRLPVLPPVAAGRAVRAGDAAPRRGLPGRRRLTRGDARLSAPGRIRGWSRTRDPATGPRREDPAPAPFRRCWCRGRGGTDRR